MSKEKVIVVGAGVAGIAAANFEAGKGNNVTLLEMDNRPGGLLKSDYNGKTYFDYGTHIIPETVNPEVNEFLFGDLSEKDYLISKRISAGNYYNDTLNQKSCYVDTKCLPASLYDKACHELLKSKNEQGVDLQQYFKSRYGNIIYQNIFKDVILKYMGECPSKLDAKTGYFFDMSRVLAFDQEVVDNLNKLPSFNNILGHHERVEGVRKYYPRRGGVGELINHLIEKITLAGVDIKTGIKIDKINYNQQQVLSVNAGDQKLSCDRLIWSVPLIFLASLAGIVRKSVRPLFRNTILYDFSFDQPLNTDCCFINVYEPTLYSGRITIYQNLEAEDKAGYSCTVEVLADDTPNVDIILLELRRMKLVDDSYQCLYANMRAVKNGFPILTSEFTTTSTENNQYYRQHFNNVIFIGKASDDAFFMTDVLTDAYEKIMK